MTTFGSREPITVIKQNHRGEKVWEYAGEVLERGANWVCLEARFNGREHDAGYVVFRHGDRFVEWFYGDRWYNVFKMYDAGDGHLKGWYCNVTRPAHIGQDAIRADDLALDVFVSPDREITVLDEDEFAALALSPEELRAARDAVEAIRRAVAAGEAPFDGAS